jgi:polyisoprenyl-teichoic acid--peptidoglycan teichoic acid transferase
MAQTQNKNPKQKSSLKTIRVLPVLLVAFIIVASLTAWMTYVAVRDFIASWEVTSGLPGVRVASGQEPASLIPDDLGMASDIPLQPVEGPEPQPWDGASRVSILVMGLDYRDWEEGQGAPRTDTMILISVDPLTRSAGMLSIPRDLWVDIPGFNPERINTAYRFGEVYKMPGGGPGLAMKTVENLLGLKIDFYAQIDFFAFERFIDEIHGVKLDIPEEIRVDPLGKGNITTLQPGVQVLPGNLALAYARARNTPGADFDRAERQQQVIMGVRNRILDFNMLPTLITKAPILYEELSSGVRTNMTLIQAIQLAWLAQQIPAENIKRDIIGTEHVTMEQTVEGYSVLKPRPERIRLLRDEIFTSSGAVSPAALNADLKDLMAAEEAKISLLNGTSTPGLAARTAGYLSEMDIPVEPGNAPELYTATTIIDYTGNPYTMRLLIDLLNITPNKIFHRYDPDSQVDVVLILGSDWANSNPMP